LPGKKCGLISAKGGLMMGTLSSPPKRVAFFISQSQGNGQWFKHGKYDIFGITIEQTKFRTMKT
jgi:hypothetical protein